MWLYYPHQVGDIIRFESLDVEISIAQIYENVTLPET